MHVVKSLGLLLIEPRHAQGQNPETRFFQHGQNLPSVALRHGIGLDDGKCALHHRRLLIFSPISAGDEQTVIPASCIALILSFAAPDPPEIIAPAWPMRRPGGAVWPAIKPTTGFFT